MSQSIGSTCGQFSALTGIGTRTEEKLSASSISDAEYTATMSLLAEAWLSTAPPPALRPYVMEMGDLAKSDGFATGSPAYFAALEPIMKECSAQGEGFFGGAPGAGFE